MGDPAGSLVQRPPCNGVRRDSLVLFISYSHEDKGFVDRLIARLIEERVHVWFDRVEIMVGESFLDKIQAAIGEADFLAAVLSRASVESAWCKEELNAALTRQLQERRIVVLPLLIEDCDIPQFLRDKKYANFASDFESGFQELLETIGSAADPTLGRQETEDFQTDYALSWGVRGNSFVTDIDGVSFSKKQPFSVLTQIQIVCNELTTQRYRQYHQEGLGYHGMCYIVSACEELLDRSDAHIALDDGKARTLEFEVASPDGRSFAIFIRCRRIGEATGSSILYHFGAIFGTIFKHLVASAPQMSEEQKQKLREIVTSPIQPTSN